MVAAAEVGSALAGPAAYEHLAVVDAGTSPAVLDRVVAAARAGGGAAVVAVPVTDTVKVVVDGTVVDTLDRDGLREVVTPLVVPVAWVRTGLPEHTDVADLVRWARTHGDVALVGPA